MAKVNFIFLFLGIENVRRKRLSRFNNLAKRDDNSRNSRKMLFPYPKISVHKNYMAWFNK
jgi:hypothetical protein